MLRFYCIRDLMGGHYSEVLLYGLNDHKDI